MSNNNPETRATDAIQDAIHTAVSVNKFLTPIGNNSVAKVIVNPKEKCNPVVNMALAHVYGNCSYYYVPYNGDPIKQSTKLDYVDKNGINFRYLYTHAPFLNLVKKSQSNWDFACEVLYKYINNREALLALNSGDPKWSRYADFMKRHTKECGHLPPTYYRAYGYYYCSRFGAYLLPSMTSDLARNWLRDARLYLQKYMDIGLGQNNKGTEIFLQSKLNEKANQKMSFKKQSVELDDKTFKTYAFSSHVPAYIDGGIQDVPLEDLLRIICEPNIQEWMDIETIQQAIQVAEIVYPVITSMVKVSSPAASGAYIVITNWQKIEAVFGTVASWWKD